MSQYKVIEF